MLSAAKESGTAIQTWVTASFPGNPVEQTHNLFLKSGVFGKRIEQPVSNVDLVIVAIGDNFGASVRIVSLLKKNKAKHICARAVDDVHKAVLEAFSIDRILTPEQDAARMFAHSLELGTEVESFQVDEDNYVFKFRLPKKLEGYHVNDLNVEQEFGLKVISLVRGNKTCNCLGISIVEQHVANEFEENYELHTDDSLVCYGLYSSFIQFWKSIR